MIGQIDRYLTDRPDTSYIGQICQKPEKSTSRLPVLRICAISMPFILIVITQNQVIYGFRKVSLLPSAKTFTCDASSYSRYSSSRHLHVMSLSVTFIQIRHDFYHNQPIIAHIYQDMGVCVTIRADLSLNGQT